MEQERLDTPPPLEEIIRRATIVDADHLQNSKLQHIDSMESHTSTSIGRTKSFSTNTSESYTPDNRRTSIAAFAKGIVRHVPDLKILHPVESKPVQTRRDSKGSASGKTQKKDRVLSFAPLPPASSKGLHEKVSKSSIIPEGPPVHSNKSSKTTNIHSPPAKGGLRDRRKVQLDLSMPIEMPDLPARGRPPADITGSLGAPRQRSPKTPWIRSRPTWEPLPIAKSAPIVEERHARDDGLCLLPGSDALIALQPSPKFERPSPKIRDRCYISRPQSRRTHSHRSGQSGYSGYSGSASASTATTPAEEERQPRTKADLQQLAQTTTRSRRWVWGGKISSEDTPPSPVSEGISRRFSFNPFRRANRISDQSVESPKGTIHSSSRAPGSKQRPPSTSLAYMDAPPSFVPPGLKRVPTPPIFDANGEVRGKLADFFFDVQGPGGPSTRNKPKSSPGGYWDSDALLMSVSHDLDNLDDEEEDEGPEGPRSDFVPTPVEFDTSGTPDLTRGDAGYLGVKPPATPSLAASGPMLGHDGWYRLHHQLSVESPDDERTLSQLALQAAEERRKFEWLVPEHLPNSPLCPLHEKYKGPSSGLCYWHGRRSGKNIRRGEYARPRPAAAAERSSGGSGQSQSQMGDYVGDLKQQGGTPTREVKKRRLVSLSSP
ncbi:hypothetical protein GMOD_00008046 [Pyrenophora seminiperda CCB06]|uniref:Uncharacterized protein n=1 Tax=Pyrenophora seminiperda CCB06 TaxID=1302712 RepID=A0A3M7MG93_9PLEO|nr:hypothetical protein GMOD_00008046 [Pyrenophora seminiperda CCB06]